jgi:2-iminobutanoate/2-iminopropanoate deaminase
MALQGEIVHHGATMRLSLFVVLMISVSVAACGRATPRDPEFINVTEPWPYPFSSAVRAGDYLFLSGQIGTTVQDGKPVLVPGGIDAETRQTFANIKTILDKAQLSLDRIVKCTVMMADMAEWPKMNDIYATYFPGKKPARAAFGATGLALGARVEIDCIALAK